MAALLGAPYKQIEAVAAGCILGARSLEILSAVQFSAIAARRPPSVVVPSETAGDQRKRVTGERGNLFILACISPKQMGADTGGFWPVVLSL